MIKRILKLLYFKIKNRGKHVKLFWSADIYKGTLFEGYNKVWPKTKFGGYLGKGSYIGTACKMRAKIGRFTSVASGCETITGQHPYKAPFVSTSPLFVSTKSQLGIVIVDHDIIQEIKRADETNRYDVIIGNDCWLGYKVSLVSGIIIGDGAVVLSRAMVTKDVEPYAIVGGVPARVLGYRYTKDQIEKLLSIKWWNFDMKVIIENKALFLDIDKFLEHFS